MTICSEQASSSLPGAIIVLWRRRPGAVNATKIRALITGWRSAQLNFWNWNGVTAALRRLLARQRHLEEAGSGAFLLGAAAEECGVNCGAVAASAPHPGAVGSTSRAPLAPHGLFLLASAPFLLQPFHERHDLGELAADKRSLI